MTTGNIMRGGQTESHQPHKLETAGSIPAPAIPREAEHDLDGTPLPAGHEQYSEDQKRFDELWEKWKNGTASEAEQHEIFMIQAEHWAKHGRRLPE